MDLIDIVVQVRALLQQHGRVSYRLLQRQFALDASTLEDVKFELIDIQEVALDKDGKMLVWVGENSAASSVQSPEAKQVQSPKFKRPSPNP